MLEEQVPYQDAADGVATLLASAVGVGMVSRRVMVVPMLVLKVAVNLLDLVMAVRVGCVAYHVAAQ